MYSPKEKKENVSRAIQPVENTQGAAQITDNRGISPAFVALQREGEEETSKKDSVEPKKLLDQLQVGEDRPIITKKYLGENRADFSDDVGAAKSAIMDMLNTYKAGMSEENLKRLLEKLEGIQVVVAGKKDFAYHMIFHDYINEIKERIEPTFLPDKYSYANVGLKKYFLQKARLEDFDFVLSHYENIPAWGGLKNTVLMNGDVATVGGAHTIVHEMMHLLANKTVVDNLRAKKNMGDEGINEYLSRVATSLSFSKVKGNLRGSWNVPKTGSGAFHDGTLYDSYVKNDEILNKNLGESGEKNEVDEDFIEKLLNYYLNGGDNPWAN